MSLGNYFFAAMDLEVGLVFFRCEDSVEGDFNTKSECSYLYKMTLEELRVSQGDPKIELNYLDVKEGLNIDDLLILRLVDRSYRSHALLFVKLGFGTASTFKLLPLKGSIQTAAMKLEGNDLNLIYITDSKPETSEIFTMKMQLANSLPESLGQIKSANSLPQEEICPQRVEFFPNQSSEIMVYSECSLESDVSRALYHFRIWNDSDGVTDLTQWRQMKRLSLTRFDLPYYCLTNNYVHIFEKGSVSE